MSTVAPIVKRPAPTPSTQSSESSSNPPRKKAKLDLLEPVNPAQKSIAETLPKKRVKVAGSIRRLANSKPFNVKVQAKATLNGSKIGGKSKDLKVDLPNDLKELAKGEIEQLFISSKAEGMNFGGWLKQGATAFTNRG